MSDGLKEAMREFMAASDDADQKAFNLTYQTLIADKDSLDGRDPWDDDEVTEIIDNLNKELRGSVSRPWLDFYDWNNKYKCDCGGEKAKTTHAHWCSTVKV